MNVTGSASGVHHGAHQQLLAAAIRATPNPFVWVDLDGNVVYLNDHARNLLGESPTPPAGPITAAVRGETVTDERCTIRRSDGRVLDLLVSAMPLRDEAGAQVGAMVIMRDVTSALLAERRLKLAERRFNALVQATGQLVWTTNAEGHVCEDSPSWRAYTGQTLTQFLGDGWLYVVHPDDRDQIDIAWRSAVTRRTDYQVEYRIRRHDGEYRWAIARGTPVLDERGVIQEWVGCTWDVHEQRGRKP